MKLLEALLTAQRPGLSMNCNIDEVEGHENAANRIVLAISVANNWFENCIEQKMFND